MQNFDLHIHTVYCDGKDTPEALVLAAIERGMECIGFSSHSYTSFDESYCMKRDSFAAYKDEIAVLKEKYKNKIKILCGIEQDLYADEPAVGFDYVIGSVHYLKVGNDYFPVDFRREILVDAVKKYYGGDIYKLAEDYFLNVTKIKNADIIGHFDLITKFNENGCLFDEKNGRYIAAYIKALDILLKNDVIFEINTGAISRGYRKTPYPSSAIIDYIKSNGGKLILSSDCHAKNMLMFEFDKYEKLL
ncbi:MAG: histidinol-phosphatase [Clostridia bacterium]|nr:histidinol-phosphatase [Clostridia bacterium]